MASTIRFIQPEDRAQWLDLWAGYLDFYEQKLSHEQTELTWQRLLDESYEIFGFVAVDGEEIMGFANFSFTHSTWSRNRDVYLEDLFVAPRSRKTGIGKTLIFHVADFARESGATKVTWVTHRDNETARRLYDSIGELSEFVNYSMPVSLES